MASSPIPMANVLDIQPEDLKFDQDHKRDLDHRHKWASGAEEENKKSEAIRVRPIKPVLNAVAKNAVRKQQGYYRKSQYKPGRDIDASDALDDGFEERHLQKHVIHKYDVGITYSYDAPHGPTGARDLLGVAISNAVEKFETKHIEKLLKDEYDVVSKDSEAGDDNAIVDKDGFELI